jgi:ribA/ribD-fused uncharacterized protein
MLPPKKILHMDGHEIHAFFGRKFGFSNFFPCQFLFAGLLWTSSEKCYQWHKAHHFGDHKAAEAIWFTDNPAIAKKLGKYIENYSRREWRKYCDQVAFTIL